MNEAEQYYKEALKYLINLNDPKAEALAFEQLGNLAIVANKLEQAEIHYQKALERQISLNDPEARVAMLLRVGLALYNHKRWESASEYYLKCISLCLDVKDSNNLNTAIKALTLLWHESKGQNLPSILGNILGISADKTEEIMRWLVSGGEVNIGFRDAES